VTLEAALAPLPTQSGENDPLKNLLGTEGKRVLVVGSFSGMGESTARIVGEQAWPPAFLNSPAASYISGENLFTDGGCAGAIMTGSIDASAMAQDAR